MQPVTSSPLPASIDVSKESERTNAKTATSFDDAAARSAALEKVGEIADGIRADAARLDVAMQRMSSGRELDSVELLRVQSLVYGYSQRVELASKVVESATSGIKQMLNTQV